MSAGKQALQKSGWPWYQEGRLGGGDGTGRGSGQLSGMMGYSMSRLGCTVQTSVKLIPNCVLMIVHFVVYNFYKRSSHRFLCFGDLSEMMMVTDNKLMDLSAVGPLVHKAPQCRVLA